MKKLITWSIAHHSMVMVFSAVLLAVGGVSQVTPIGGDERQYQVIAHPEQLRASGVSLNELVDAVKGASQNTSAGVLTEGPQEYVLQAIGRVRSPAEVGETVIA